VNQRIGAKLSSFGMAAAVNTRPREGGFFEQQFVQQLLTAVLPEIKGLIREVLADELAQPLLVDYEEAGRMIGTTYEGIRKLVRKGRLKAVSRSGRHRGIAVAELKNYVQRSQLEPQCDMPRLLE
jgi:hypothetical protein